VLGAKGVPAVQCPLWMLRAAGLPPMRNYTDIMMRFGFLDRVGLRGLVRAWHQLLALLRPSLILLEHSPLATFATRDRGVPRVRLGTGFCCPPLQTPMPTLAWWASQPSPFDEVGERNVVKVANEVSSDLGMERVGSVAHLLRTEGEFLCTFPELDHYRGRQDASYEGPVFGDGGGAALPLPPGDDPCAFVYLSIEYPHLEALVRALDRGAFRALIHVPGLAPVRAAALSGIRVRFTPTVIPLNQAGRDCAFAITHGGYGTTNSLLLHGRPQLLLTRHMEQMMHARRAEELGAAVAIDPAPGAPDFDDALKRLLQDDRHERSAIAFAAAHRDYDSAATATSLAARCQEWL